MDNIKFNPENVEKYVKRNNVHNRAFHAFYPFIEFSTHAIMTLFDKNADGYITKKEFSEIEKEQYNSYIADLKIYNEERGFDGRILNFESLADLVDKGSIPMMELDLNVHEPSRYKVKNLPERKDLKDSSQMTEEELRQELISYKGDVGDEYFEFLEREGLQQRLVAAREELSYYDKNSDVVDWNIGTYTQGKHGLCGFLAVIESFPPERLKSLYSENFDENGNKYYEVNFPIDSQDPKPIIITDAELKNGEITYKNPDSSEEQSLGILSKGDLDVTLLEAAVLKRFGDYYFKNGSPYLVFENILKRPDKEKYIVKKNLTEDDFRSFKPGVIIATLTFDQLKELGLKRTFTLSDGRTGEYYFEKIRLSDGTRISRDHAMSVKYFDDKTQELVIQGNELNSLSELRIPVEMSKYFEVSIPVELEKE